MVNGNFLLCRRVSYCCRELNTFSLKPKLGARQSEHGVGNDLFMTYFSLFQQVTGSDLNTLQRDIDTEVRQLKSQIQQLESSIQDFEYKLMFRATTTIFGCVYVFLFAYLLTLHK